MPPRDGTGDEELVAQIIPLRRRAGPIAPARSPDRRPREVLDPPREPPAPTERSVWDQPMPELRRRPLPDSVWSTDTPAPSAGAHQGWAARWALMPAAMAVAAVAIVALALVVGGLLLTQAEHGGPHAGSSASRGRVPARAAHESAKPRSTASRRARAAGAARRAHSTQDRHTHRAAATHPAVGTTPTVGESAPASTSAGAPATVQESSAPASASSGVPAGEPASSSTPQTTGSSPAVPTTLMVPTASSAGEAPVAKQQENSVSSADLRRSQPSILRARPSQGASPAGCPLSFGDPIVDRAVGRPPARLPPHTLSRPARAVPLVG